MSSFIIRRFNPTSDLNAVQNINRNCLPENYPRFFFTEIYERFPDGFNIVIDETTNEVVAYVMTRIEKGLSNFGFGLCKKGHIISIAVMPQYRRKGLAKKLMLAANHALRLRDVKEVYLEVRESNQAAINLYQQLGYITMKVSKRYYSDGEAALIMVAKI
ncbi:MAG: GNAT family N-acetyltransferase [Candidatus Heimdallarchaeota archaeon]